jgi:hypothetical protein
MSEDRTERPEIYHILEKFPPIAYGSRSAGRAFDPPIGEQAIRTAIKRGDLKAYRQGKNMKYILRDDLVAWVKAGGECR